MKIGRFMIGTFVALLFVNCTHYGENFKAEMHTTDSLTSLLNQSFERYNLNDTNTLVNLYGELLKTDKYAGLAFDFQKIHDLKFEFKKAITSDRRVRREIMLTKTRLKALKQSLRHNEYDKQTFSLYLNQEQSRVSNLIRNMNTTREKTNDLILHSDSLFLSLRRK